MNDDAQAFERELQLEKRLRKFPWLIPALSLIVAAAFAFGTYTCMKFYEDGALWTFIPAAFFIHSFFIVLIHDAAHQNITQTRFDRVLLNFGAGIMLLPVYGEGFRRYHLIHHAHTNEAIDPLWSPLKEQLFQKQRLLYFLFEFVPFFSTIYGIISFGSKQKQQGETTILPHLQINYGYVLAASLVSVGVYLLLRPPLLFLLFTMLVLNVISTFRHWSEHLGEYENKESNTFWFPLGMGIGNHETHHRYAFISWFCLMIGLFHRKKDTGPLRVVAGVLFSNRYKHYK